MHFKFLVKIGNKNGLSYFHLPCSFSGIFTDAFFSGAFGEQFFRAGLTVSIGGTCKQ